MHIITLHGMLSYPNIGRSKHTILQYVVSLLIHSSRPFVTSLHLSSLFNTCPTQ